MRSLPRPLYITLNGAEMADAARVGALRQQAALSRGFKANGFGSVRTHTGGRMAEQAVANWLKVPLDPAWTWEADRRRGCDVVGPDGTKWHVRSSSLPGAYKFIWRPGKDARYGNWVYAVTAHAPCIRLVGWGPAGQIAREAIGTDVFDMYLYSMRAAA